MPVFHYKVVTDKGTVLEKETVADEAESLRRELEEKGYFVLKIQPVGASQGLVGVGKAVGFSPSSVLLTGSTFARFSFKKRGVKARDLIVFNQEFLALIKAGLPILQCLDILIERMENERFAEILTSVREDIRGGGHLSKSLEKYPQIPRLYTAFLQVGENSGAMAEVVQRYINYLKVVDIIRQKVKNAMLYPVILLFVVTAVVIFLLTYAVPTFAEMYKDFAKELPLATRILMQLTSFIKGNIMVIILLVAGSVVAFRTWFKTSSGKLTVWRIILNIPMLKNIISRYFVSQISRTLALVLGSGIPLLQSLDIVHDSLTNPILANRIQKASMRIKEGGSLAQALSEERVMEALPIQMVHVGESTGALEEMLKTVADLYDEEMTQTITRMTTLIEPILMLCMGVLVGGIVIIMYLPIFYLGSAAG